MNYVYDLALFISFPYMDNYIFTASVLWFLGRKQLVYWKTKV